MVLPILVALISAPGLLGTQEAIRQSQAKEKREEHRARRCNLIATCVKSSLRSREINGRPIVLKNGKLWIDTGTSDGSPYGHPYAGYYLPYPDSQHEGLVTTITDEAPIMNWVYVDKDTYEVKYGVRLNAQPNLTGPFDCTRQDRRMTFHGWEGWCAVEEFPTLWALYYDVDDNGLRSKVAPGTRVLEIELSRKEKRFKKEPVVRQEDQTTKREVDAKEDTPVDKPVTMDPQVTHPGVMPDAKVAQPEPLKMPKSIFVDDPQLKPPAVMSDEKATQPEPSKISKSIFVDRPQPSQPEVQVPRSPKTPPPAHPTTNQPSQTPRPPSNAESTPSPPTGSQATPVGEKRSAPKLDRNSRSRTLTQAQMFEAMAVEQKPSNEMPFRIGKSNSRPQSNIDSASEYSGGRRSVDNVQTFSGRPDDFVLPPSATAHSPTRLQQSGTKTDGDDPAVFGGFSGRSLESLTRSKKRSIDQISGKATLPRPTSSSGNSIRRPISPVKTTSRPTTAPNNNQTSSTGRARTVSPEQRRTNALRDTSASRTTPRSINRLPDQRSSPSSTRQRNGSTSSQSQSEEASRPSVRSLFRNNTVAGQRSMVSTMTSGTGNRGMANRLGSGEGLPAVTRTRTTSTLHRESDDSIKSEDVVGNRTVSRTTGATRGRSAGSPSTRREEGNRPPPLRRAAASGLNLRDAAMDRDKNQSGSNRIKNLGRGLLRRGTGDPEKGS